MVVVAVVVPAAVGAAFAWSKLGRAAPSDHPAAAQLSPTATPAPITTPTPDSSPTAAEGG